MSFLFKADPARGAEWARLFAQHRPDLPFHIWPETGDPAAVRYLAAWIPPTNLATRFPNLEVVFSVAAGIDQFNLADIPAAIPLVRMIEPGLTASMVDYAVMAVLALHRDLPAYREHQQARRWQPMRVQAASQRRVGVLGLGELARAVLAGLAPFGFALSGWSRSRYAIPGVACHAGAAEMPGFLRGCDILVNLLPLTPETRGLLGRDLFAQLPAGASLVNVGRGGHLVQADLLAALDTGHLSAAILDVMEPEPLPPEHPLWAHPRIWITPHVASMTHPDSAVPIVLANLERHARGEPMQGLVDRSRGY